MAARKQIPLLPGSRLKPMRGTVTLDISGERDLRGAGCFAGTDLLSSPTPAGNQEVLCYFLSLTSGETEPIAVFSHFLTIGQMGNEDTHCGQKGIFSQWDRACFLKCLPVVVILEKEKPFYILRVIECIQVSKKKGYKQSDDLDTNQMEASHGSG